MTLDLVLPNLDGFAVLERVRQRRDLDDMPIVVISAIADAATVKRAYGLGVVDFVAKPFNVDLLDAKLKVFLKMQRLADEVRVRQAFLEGVVDHLSSGLIVVDEHGRDRQGQRGGVRGAVARGRVAASGARIAEALPGAEPLFLVSGDAAQRRVTIKTPNGERNLGFTNAAVEVNGSDGRAGGVSRAIGGRGGAARAGGAGAPRGAGVSRRAASRTRCAIRWRRSAPRRR